MAQQMLDFDRDVITEPRKFPVHGLDDCEGVRGPVKKVRIAECDVLGACIDLLADIFEHDVPLHNAKNSVVDRNDGAMTAKVFASPAGFGIAGDFEASIGP